MNQQELRDLVRQGVRAARTGNNEQAEQLLKRALRENRRIPDAWYWLSMVVDDPDEQLKSVKRVLQLRPEHEKAQERLAELTAPPPEDDDPFAMFEDDDDEDDPFAMFEEAVADDAGDSSRVVGDDGEFDNPFAEADDDDDFAGAFRADQPVADSNSRQLSESAGAAAGQAADAASKVAGQAREGLQKGMKEIQERGLLQKWWAALRFDARLSYESYRRQGGNVGSTTRLLAMVFLLAPLLFIPYAMLLSIGTVELSSIDVGFLIELLIRFLIANAVFSAALIAAIYAASHAAAYIARQVFESTVSGAEHYSLSTLYFVPVYLLTIVLIMLSVFIPRIAGILPSPTNFQFIALISLPISFTASIFSLYVFGQFSFSISVIHRLQAIPTIIVSMVFGAILMLVLVWLSPVALLLLPSF